ncbi:MAG: NAD(P)-dependent oxidoreductase [Christensenellales bacterium]
MESLFMIQASDNRNLHLAYNLQKKGYNVALWRAQTDHQSIAAISDEELSCKDSIMVLSLTATQDKIDNVLRLLSPGCVVFGGRISDENLRYSQSCGLQYIDLLSYEPFSILNAIPTAEGALHLAIEHTSHAINGARVLVLGYGRVGKATARLFSAAGARVDVLTQSPQERALARLNGLRSLALVRLTSRFSRAQIVINTIPARILGRAELRLLPPKCLIIDLSSPPGGTDHQEAQRLGLTSLHALALPDKYAPQSAAEYMESSILTLLHEMEGDTT